jgi:hypothetical protein
MTGITFEDEFFGFLDGAIHQQKRLADRVMVRQKFSIQADDRCSCMALTISGVATALARETLQK